MSRLEQVASSLLWLSKGQPQAQSCTTEWRASCTSCKPLTTFCLRSGAGNKRKTSHSQRTPVITPVHAAGRYLRECLQVCFGVNLAQ